MTESIRTTPPRPESRGGVVSTRLAWPRTADKTADDYLYYVSVSPKLVGPRLAQFPRRGAAPDAQHSLPEICPVTAVAELRRSRVDDVDDLEVSVVMPCLNEARTVGRCVDKAVRALEQLGVRGEVIVADNGSTDGSQDIARGARGPRRPRRPARATAAPCQAGIAAARGRYIIMGDADDSYDFSHLEPFIERLASRRRPGHGQPLPGRHQPRRHALAAPLHRQPGPDRHPQPVLPHPDRRRPLRPARLPQGRLRAPGPDAPPGMEFASEMVVKACLHEQKISEVPTVLHPDGRDRPPHLRSFRDGWRHLRFLLLMCPLWLYLIPSGLLLGGGLGADGLADARAARSAASASTSTPCCSARCASSSATRRCGCGPSPESTAGRAASCRADTFSARVFEHLNLERGLIAGAGAVPRRPGPQRLAGRSSGSARTWAARRAG